MILQKKIEKIISRARKKYNIPNNDVINEGIYKRCYLDVVKESRAINLNPQRVFNVMCMGKYHREKHKVISLHEIRSQFK